MKDNNSYSYERKGNEITFWSSNSLMVNDIAIYIENVLDATRYRNQLKEVKRIKEDD